MRAAAIFGLGCSAKNLTPFQTDASIDWLIEMPAAADQADIILLFGGDGTIHRHLSQLVKLGLSVLVVPAGSGNDFARALGLRRVRDSIAAWQSFCEGRDNVRAIDLGVVTPLEVAGQSPAPQKSARDSVPGTRHYFCSVAGVGLSLIEMETQIVIASNLGYISHEIADRLAAKSGEVSRLLHGLMQSLQPRVVPRTGN